MKDNEIIKALECCAGDDGCGVCPMYKPSSECITELQGKALDLINRLESKVDFMTEQRDIYMQDATELSQKVDKLEAENKRLQTDNSSMQSTLAKMSMGVEQAKSEAIKAFAERLRKHYDEYDDYDDIYVRHIRDDIDFTLDDMVGDKNEKNT